MNLIWIILTKSGDVASEFGRNEMDSSFHPSYRFQDCFGAPPSETGVPVTFDTTSYVPQLQKLGQKVSP